jgi:alpha-galactosidase/6-phospho-beta-glucosidase family protein
MLEVNTANSKIVAETQEEMKAVEQYMSDIQDISHKFDFVTKHGSEKQIFRLMKTLETGLSRKFVLNGRFNGTILALCL